MLRQQVAHVIDHLRPGGGPSGYLWNLRDALAQSHARGIVVAAASESRDRAPSLEHSTRAQRVLRALPKPILAPTLVRRYIRRFWRQPVCNWPMVQDSAVVVWHHPMLAASYLSSDMRGQEQRIGVMCHSPTDAATELMESTKARYGESRVWVGAFRELAEEELRSYERCEVLLAPNKSSLDAYFAEFPDLKRRFDRLGVHELPTGVAAHRATVSGRTMRQQLGVPLQAKVVGYFGRYHKHKGYDLFLGVADIARKAGRDWIFISAGTGSLGGVTAGSSVIDLGWRADIANVMQVADVVIAPNRVTYFDLGILEAMSLALPVVSTKTGGNVVFPTVTEGVRLVAQPDVGLIYEELSRVLAQMESLQELGRANRRAYEVHFTAEAFAQRHVDLAAALLAGSRV